MNKLSVVIIARDEEARIADAIQSASMFGEVVVLDSGSTDRTCEIARELGATVHHQDWLGFGAQKQRAVELASNDWVFVLDADERISPALQHEIDSVLQAPKHDGYYVPRLSRYFGRYMKSCGLYPDYTIRLYNRTKGKFDNATVHESVQLSSKPGCLKNHMLHLAYESVEQFIQKQNHYSSLSHKPKSITKALFNPYWTFIKLYLIKGGILEGWHGFVISKLYAQYTFWKYIKAPNSEL